MLAKPDDNALAKSSKLNEQFEPDSKIKVVEVRKGSPRAPELDTSVAQQQIPGEVHGRRRTMPAVDRCAVKHSAGHEQPHLTMRLGKPKTISEIYWQFGYKSSELLANTVLHMLHFALPHVCHTGAIVGFAATIAWGEIWLNHFKADVSAYHYFLLVLLEYVFFTLLALSILLYMVTGKNGDPIPGKLWHLITTIQRIRKN